MSAGPLSWARSGVLDLAGREQPLRCAITVAAHDLDTPPPDWTRVPVADLARRRGELFGAG